jgi:hypothetical protein
MRVAFPGAEGAKLAGKNANIRVVDVPVQNITGAVPVFPFANNVRYEAERVDVIGSIELRSFVLIDSFSGRDLVVD